MCAMIPDMDEAWAQRYADTWVRHWNNHDIEALLADLADDVVFTSPIAERLTGDGVVRGKAALHAYWAKGLERFPDLRFEVLGVYAGVHTLVINYRNQNGGLVNEVLVFDGDRVVTGHGTYLSG